jgi:hypothetical protein
MAKYKVISKGDQYCIRRLEDDGTYVIVPGSYYSSWHEAESYMAKLQLADAWGEVSNAERKTGDSLIVALVLMGIVLLVWALL